MEKITRSNPWKGEVSPSSLDTASCFRKFLYDKVLGISPDIPKVALVFGTCIHKGIETYYISKTTLGHTQASLLGLQAFSTAWDAAACDGDIKRNYLTGVTLLHEYFKVYEKDSTSFVPSLVECEQWMELPNGCMLLMKIDRVRDENKYFTVVDTKTTTMALTEYYFRNFENALATTLYFWGVASILGQCDAVQIDAVHIPVDQRDPGVGFVRRVLMRTELQVHEAITTVVYRTNHIRNVLSGSKKIRELLEAMPCNQHNCNDYGGCPYIGICKYGFSHPSLCVDFKATNVIGEFIMEQARKNVKGILETKLCEGVVV